MHFVQCPSGKSSNPDCMIYHDPNHLEELRQHILSEVRLRDRKHCLVAFNTDFDFENPEIDLKQVFYFKKNYFDDLESNVRSWIFEPIINIEYQPSTLVQVKSTKAIKIKTIKPPKLKGTKNKVKGTKNTKVKAKKTVTFNENVDSLEYETGDYLDAKSGLLYLKM